MPKMVVNTDAYMLAVPNPTPNQPALARSLRRGEVVDVSDEEAKRGTEAKVTNHYTVAGVNVAREESALIPASEAEGYAANARRAVAESRREALQRELAEVEGQLAGPTVSTEDDAAPPPTKTPTKSAAPPKP